MQWWMRPGPSRCWAIRKPAPRAPSSASVGHAHVLVEDLGVAAVARRSARPGAPSSAMSRTMFTPGVSTGTMNIEARWCGCASGSVTAMTIRKSATERVGGEPLVAVDDPLVAVARPRASAAASGREPAVSGSVIENAERRSPASSGCRQLLLLVRRVPASARISELPESGAWLPNTAGANGLEPRISCISPSLTWPKPWPPSSGGRCAAHRPRSLHLLLQRRDRALEAVLAELVEDGLDRPDLVAHEVAHPVELLPGTRLGGEVPCHRRHARTMLVEHRRCDMRRPRALMPLAAAAAVAAGAALQSATGFGFSLVAAPLLFAAVDPEEAVGLLIVLGSVVNLLTLASERRRPRPRGARVRRRAGLGAARARWPAWRCCARSTRSRCRSRSRRRGRDAGRARGAPPERRDAGAGRRRWPGSRPGALTTSTTTAGPPLLVYLLGPRARRRRRCATR